MNRKKLIGERVHRQDLPTVDDLLDGLAAPARKHVIARMPELAEAIAYFLRLKRDEDPRAAVSLRYFYLEKLRPQFGGPGFDAVRHYVAEVLLLNITTGTPLA